MANPQPDQFTRISNELMEQIPKFKFNGTQLRILFVVLRYTYGFNRKSHPFSLTFFEKSLGSDRRGIQRELKSLIAANVLIENKEGNHTRELMFNKDYETWEIATSSGELSNGEFSNGESSGAEKMTPSSGELSATPEPPVAENCPPKKESILKKTKKEKYKYTSEHLDFAKYLLKWILHNKPNYKQPTTLEPWANTFRLMIEADCRSPGDIKAVIDWCQRDPFWKTNILSADTLRKQYDRLEMQMNNKKVVNLTNGRTGSDQGHSSRNSGVGGLILREKA